MAEWIVSKKQRPTLNTYVLAYDNSWSDDDIFIGIIRKHSGKMYWCYENYFPMYTVKSNVITHWMPLPKPPSPDG